MTLGYNGESCADAMRRSLQAAEKVTWAELYKRTKKRGPWQDTTLRRQAIQLIVNLGPARGEWPNARPFLLLNPDGTFELYDPKRHPRPLE